VQIQAFTPNVAHARLLATMNIEWHIGDVIAKLRRAKRMNQTQLGEKVGVNKATIVRAEDGDVKVARDTYIKIARELGTELAALEVEAARLTNDKETQRTTVASSSSAGSGFPKARRDQ